MSAAGAAACRRADLGGGIPVWLAHVVRWSLVLAASLARTAADGLPAFRVGVSYASFGTVSRNDAAAAIKAWAGSMGIERRLRFPIHTALFDDESDLARAVSRGEIDAASMTVAEFLRSGLEVPEVLVTATDQGHEEEYVVVVGRDRSIRSIADLAGRRMVRHDSPRTSLAWPWFETELLREGLPSAREALESVVPMDNPSKAILRVFFGQADACLVTANAFMVAGELNPQLQRKLQVLRVSPPVVPSLLFFRAGVDPAMRSAMEAAILDLHTTPSGRQVLTVSQGSRMKKLPASALETSRRVYLDHERASGGVPAPTRAEGKERERP